MTFDEALLTGRDWNGDKRARLQRRTFSGRRGQRTIESSTEAAEMHAASRTVAVHPLSAYGERQNRSHNGGRE